MTLRKAVSAAALVLSLVQGAMAFAAQAPKAVPIPEDLGKKVVARYTEVARSAYDGALTGAKTLQGKIDAFIKAPTPESLEAARQAWKAARLEYSATEAFRFYGGPIDDPKTGPEGLVNAWPIDESYLDYVEGAPSSGIINDPKTFPTLTKALLVEANEKNGEKNISTGFHAIEFLLWGQDTSLASAGQRKASDYIVGQSPNAQRRGEALGLLGALLVQHLEQVLKAWDDYGMALQKEPLTESLRRIYTGITSLSIDEMAGERMTVALEKNEQEHEQDCFSDFTLSDLIADEMGIQQVYFGRVKGKVGPSLSDLVRAIDPELAVKTDLAMRAALEDLKTIPPPFDRVISLKDTSPARRRARAAIKSLEDQARAIAASGHKLGLILNVQ